MIEKIKKIVKSIYIYSKSRVSRILSFCANYLKHDNVKSFFLNTIKSNNLRTFALVFLFILFPIALNSIFVESKLKTSIFVALYLCFPIFIFTNKIKRYLLLMVPLIYIPYLSNLSHYFIFKQPMSNNVVLAIFETNAKEAFGFVKEYTNIWVISLLIMTIAIFVVYFKSLKINGMDKNAKYFPFFQKLFLLLFVASSIEGRFTIYAKHKRQTIPSFLLSSYMDFKDELEVLRIKRNRKIVEFKNIKSLFGNQKQTFVVVIGESASREHYEIFGYNRKTNPLLSKRKDIYSFYNVKSPHGQTLLSLKKVLTFASFDDMSLLYTKGSMVNYFKDAGFKTFWLTKQENLSKYSTYTNVVAHEADIYEDRQQVEKLAGEKAENNDYSLIYRLEKALADKANKKVIFLHLDGSHSPYDEHTKKGYTPFTDNQKYSIFDKHRQKMDQYDNTIVLNDLLLNTIIEILKKQNDISYMVYFSDHGEDATNDSDTCFCHYESHPKRELLLTIPFITWVSPKYESFRPDFVNSFNKKLGTAYNTQHLIHSVMSLSGLSNPDIEKSKSIFD